MHMKKLLLILLFIPLCMACKKEPIDEPLLQYNFIEFVDASGQNLFESGKIDTSEFQQISGNLVLTWEDIMDEKKRSATQAQTYGFITEPYADAFNSLFRDNNLLLEVSQGYLGYYGGTKRVFSINGVEHTLTYSLKERFYQNGKKIESSTDNIDKYTDINLQKV